MLDEKLYAGWFHLYNILETNKQKWQTDKWFLDINKITPKLLQMVTAAMKLKDTYSLEGKFWPN